MQTDATSHNIVACCWGCVANNVASVCMGLKVQPVSNYTQQVPTSANIVVVPCKRTQHVGPNNVGCCWPTMLRLFCMGLKTHSNGRNKSQHCWAQHCWELLALVGTCCVVYANERNNCQHCWRKFMGPLAFFPQIIVFI